MDVSMIVEVLEIRGVMALLQVQVALTLWSFCGSWYSWLFGSALDVVQDAEKTAEYHDEIQARNSNDWLEMQHFPRFK